MKSLKYAERVWLASGSSKIVSSARRRKGATLAELLEASGFGPESAPALSRCLTGQRSIPLENLQRLETFLGIELKRINKETDARPLLSALGEAESVVPLSELHDLFSLTALLPFPLDKEAWREIIRCYRQTHT